MRYIIRILIIFLTGIFVVFTFYLCIQSHHEVTSLLSAVIHKPNKIDEIKSIYLTQAKFSAIRYALIFISGMLIFLSYFLWIRTDFIILKLKTVSTFFSSQFRSFKNGLQSMTTLNKISLFLIVFGFALWNLFNLITRPISCDETGTHILYSSQNLLLSLTRYSANNHPLNSIFMTVSNFLPFETKIALRIPNYIFGLVNILLLFALVRSVYVVPVAVFAACLYGFAYPVMIYGFQARGYELVLLFTMLSLFSAIKIILYRQKYYWLIFTAASVLGFYSVLSFLYAYIPIVAFIFLYSVIKKEYFVVKQLILSGLVTLLFSILLYTPFFAFSGFSTVFNNEFVKSKPLTEVFQLFPSHCQATLNFLFGTGGARRGVENYSGNSGIFVFLGLIAAFTFSFFKLKEKKHLLVSLLVLIFIVLSPMLLFIQRVIPYERTWIHLLPIIILLVSGILSFIHRSYKGSSLHIIAILGAIVYASSMMYNFNKRYYLWYDRDYQAEKMSDFILQKNTGAYYIYTNEMILSSTLEFELICKKEKYKFEYGYFKNVFFNKDADYDFILWDKNYSGSQKPPVQYPIIYSNNFINIYQDKIKF